ncbi:MAG: sugar O-acetyltransferase [Clostridium celatum]|uniref:sugar O-acetyltransferase n=1 Tax=Clostridium sp. TaxID=1506 RepID=UPI0025C32341|nr:sugar O-acetyltransferase [Clostridium sp.]MBS4958869.1 sugar O-acetyltransferase [Clostridium sp.]MDU2124017.1 sugar O-acetyltransferase [Clostridium celatum]MDU4980904.1 sugar O-acetyltransferase [Clostridium celatum]
MTEKEKMLKGFIYDTSDPELVKLRKIARDIARKFNNTTEDEVEIRKSLLKEVLGKIGEGTEINPDIKLDYGCNIYIGDRCYINFNSVFLDCAEICLGNDVFVGPGVSFVTPIHPMISSERNARLKSDGSYYMLEYAQPINIGDNVWICSNVTILPGVSIGSNTVIGAGSVVTKDIPSNVLAVGNPCRVIRNITEQDKVTNYY